MSFEGIARVIGWRALVMCLDLPSLLKIKHRQKQMVKEFSHEW
jgi:signal transduction protein with GAF and PtsI domain